MEEVSELEEEESGRASHTQHEHQNAEEECGCENVVGTYGIWHGVACYAVSSALQFAVQEAVACEEAVLVIFWQRFHLRLQFLALIWTQYGIHLHRPVACRGLVDGVRGRIFSNLQHGLRLFILLRLRFFCRRLLYVMLYGIRLLNHVMKCCLSVRVRTLPLSAPRGRVSPM